MDLKKPGNILDYNNLHNTGKFSGDAPKNIVPYSSQTSSKFKKDVNITDIINLLKSKETQQTDRETEHEQTKENILNSSDEIVRKFSPYYTHKPSIKRLKINHSTNGEQKLTTFYNIVKFVHKNDNKNSKTSSKENIPCVSNSVEKIRGKGIDTYISRNNMPLGSVQNIKTVSNEEGWKIFDATENKNENQNLYEAKLQNRQDHFNQIIDLRENQNKSLGKHNIPFHEIHNNPSSNKTTDLFRTNETKSNTIIDKIDNFFHKATTTAEIRNPKGIFGEKVTLENISIKSSSTTPAKDNSRILSSTKSGLREDQYKSVCINKPFGMFKGETENTTEEINSIRKRTNFFKSSSPENVANKKNYDKSLERLLITTSETKSPQRKFREEFTLDGFIEKILKESNNKSCTNPGTKQNSNICNNKQFGLRENQHKLIDECNNAVDEIYINKINDTFKEDETETTMEEINPFSPEKPSSSANVTNIINIAKSINSLPITTSDIKSTKRKFREEFTLDGFVEKILKESNSKSCTNLATKENSNICNNKQFVLREKQHKFLAEFNNTLDEININKTNHIFKEDETETTTEEINPFSTEKPFNSANVTNIINNGKSINSLPITNSEIKSTKRKFGEEFTLDGLTENISKEVINKSSTNPSKENSNNCNIKKSDFSEGHYKSRFDKLMKKIACNSNLVQNKKSINHITETDCNNEVNIPFVNQINRNTDDKLAKGSEKSINDNEEIHNATNKIRKDESTKSVPIRNLQIKCSKKKFANQGTLTELIENILNKNNKQDEQNSVIKINSKINNSEDSKNLETNEETGERVNCVIEQLMPVSQKVTDCSKGLGTLEYREKSPIIDLHESQTQFENLPNTNSTSELKNINDTEQYLINNMIYQDIGTCCQFSQESGYYGKDSNEVINSQLFLEKLQGETEVNYSLHSKNDGIEGCLQNTESGIQNSLRAEIDLIENDLEKSILSKIHKQYTKYSNKIKKNTNSNKLEDIVNSIKSTSKNPSENSSQDSKCIVKRYRKNKTKIYKIKSIGKRHLQSEKVEKEDSFNFQDVLKKMLTDDENKTQFTKCKSPISTPSSYISDDGKSDTLSTGSKELSSPQQRLRSGFNELSKDKSLCYSEQQWDDVSEYDKENIKIKIQDIFFQILDDFKKKKTSVFKHRRQSFDNCIFRDGRLQLKPASESTMTVISSKAQRSKAKFQLMSYIMIKIQTLLETNTKLTKRELYYELKTLISDQGVTDRAINAVSCLLDVGMWALNIIAQKGLVFGNLKLLLSSGETLNCNIPGTLIPQDINDIVEIHSPAYFILVVEKESIFNKLIEEDLPNKLTRPFIMITGKGFPDLNTQLFLRKLWMVMLIPVFILVDADPHGINIMLNYRFGSVRNAHVSQHLAVPNAKWLGVYPSEITIYNLKRQPLSEEEIKLVNNILKTPYMEFSSKLVDELNVLLTKKYKAGIEGLVKTGSYLSDVYLPNKFFSHNFI